MLKLVFGPQEGPIFFKCSLALVSRHAETMVHLKVPLRKLLGSALWLFTASSRGLRGSVLLVLEVLRRAKSSLPSRQSEVQPLVANSKATFQLPFTLNPPPPPPSPPHRLQVVSLAFVVLIFSLFVSLLKLALKPLGYQPREEDVPAG